MTDDTPDLTITSLEDFIATSEPLTPNWGPWRLDAVVRVLYPDHPYRYEVDLDRCRSSAEVLDWICQITSKQWADDATLAGLVRALNDVLHPQGTLCSFGSSRKMTKKQIATRVEQWANTHG